jgi:hypothetical protein
MNGETRSGGSLAEGFNPLGSRDRLVPWWFRTCVEPGSHPCIGFVPPMFDDVESALAFVGERARSELERLFTELDGGSPLSGAMARFAERLQPD